MDRLGRRASVGGPTISLYTAIPPRLIPHQVISYDNTVSDPRENRDASISVAVAIIISIIMVPMMVSVPPLPPVFVGVTVVAVAVVAVVVRSVWLVSGANVNAEPIVCFGFGGCRGNQPERRQPQKDISFI